MNNPNPLIPQGSLIERKARNRPHLRIAIAIVAVHLVFLGGLLIQGCGKEDLTAKNTQPTNESAFPPLTDTSNLYNSTSAFAQPSHELAHTSAPVTSLPTQSPTPLPPLDQVVPAATRDYVVLKGDNFTTIGKKFGVSALAIAKANPGIDSTRLQLGQKLVIPPPSATSVATATVAGENTYLVKTGDTLLKIATANGTTVKDIKALNGLTTDRIKVGDKLKLPARSSPATSNSTATNLGTPTPGGTSNL